MDEIKTILDADTELIETTIIRADLMESHKEKMMLLKDAVMSLQQSLPDDLEARREAAAKNITEFHDEIDPSCPGSVLRYIAEYHHGLTDGSLAAFKRVLGIHTGDFSAESEYFQTEPEYPEQWLQHMSEESAEWLHEAIKDTTCDIGSAFGLMPLGHPPEELLHKGLVSIVDYDFEADSTLTAKVNKNAFSKGLETGCLELPDSIDEEEL